MLLPIDVLCAPSVDAAGARAGSVKEIDDVTDHLAIVDIGPRTIERYADEIRRSKTIFWNGPVGVFEIQRRSRPARSASQSSLRRAAP